MPAGPLKQSINPELVASVKKMAVWPIENITAEKIIQPFGTNYIWFYRAIGILGHSGIDFRAQIGTPVKAVFDGQVTEVSYESGGGNKIEYCTTGFNVSGYDGSYRLRCVVLHLSKQLVGLNWQVKAGDTIALSGNSGRYTTGPHLHLAIKIDKKTEDGWLVLDKDNGFGGFIDPETFFPNKVYILLPVDYRYNQPQSVKAELYKKTITPWLRIKLKRRPSERELNGYAYGKYPFEIVQDPAQYNVWTQFSYDEWKKMSVPPTPLGI